MCFGGINFQGETPLSITIKLMLIQLTLLEIEYFFHLLVSQFKKRFLERTFVLKKL